MRNEQQEDDSDGTGSVPPRSLRAPGRALRGLLLLLLAAGSPLMAAAAGSAAQGSIQTLTIHRNIAWSGAALPDGRGLLDIHVPEGARSAPVVLFVHGGGLLAGDKALAAHIGLRLAREGFITVNVNHRLSPAVRHPVHVQDAAAATGWVLEHIADYGGDPDRVVLSGHSSGGYLVGLLSTEQRWLAEAGVGREQLRGIAPISGFFHVERLAPERPKSVWGEDPARWPLASPAAHVDARVPPTLLIWADGDDDARRQENIDFAAALEAAGVEDVETLVAEARDHRSIFFLMGTPGDATTEALIGFVRRVAADELAAGEAQG